MSNDAADLDSLTRYRSRVRGCLLGGAIGDALGGPVEFWDLGRIQRECGDQGVREYVVENVGGTPVYGRITDDTQMTLFTVEGMIRASVRADRGSVSPSASCITPTTGGWTPSSCLALTGNATAG